MTNEKLTAILLLSCPDRVGLVSRISHFIFERGGNILDLDEHVDPEEKDFSIRVAWDMNNFSISPADLRHAVQPLAKEFKAKWEIKYLEYKSKVAIFVSKYDHCLHDILWRYKMGDSKTIQNSFLFIFNHEREQARTGKKGITIIG